MYEIKKPSAIDNEYVLNPSQLRDPLTWVPNVSTTSQANATRLNFSNSYYDVTPIKNARPTITLTDKSANQFVATGKVGGISNEGVLFDASTNNEEALQVQNYN